MMRGRMAHVIVVTGADGTLEFRDGTEWKKVPFVGNVTASGGEAPEVEVAAYEGVGVAIGKLRLKQVAVELPSWVPIHPYFSTLRARSVANAVVNWRLRTDKYEVFASTGSAETVAIAADGTITFVGATAGRTPNFGGERFGVGMVLEVGATKYVVEKIDGNMAVVTAAAAVAAAEDYKITVESMENAFEAKIRNQGDFEMGAETPLSSNLSLKCTHILEDWSIAA